MLAGKKLILTAVLLICTLYINSLRIFSVIWDKVFNKRPSKICGRQPLKNFTSSILECLVPYLYFTYSWKIENLHQFRSEFSYRIYKPRSHVWRELSSVIHQNCNEDLSKEVKQCEKWTHSLDIYLLKFNIGNTRTICWICLKLAIRWL